MRHVTTLGYVVSARNTFVIVLIKIIAEGTTQMRDVPVFVHRWQKLSQVSTHRLWYSTVTPVLSMRHVTTLGYVVSARNTFLIVLIKITAEGTTQIPNARCACFRASLAKALPSRHTPPSVLCSNARAFCALCEDSIVTSVLSMRHV